MTFHRGDLVLDPDGRYALVLGVVGERARVRRGDGLVLEVWESDLEPVPIAWRDPSTAAAANFAEELRPDWADPHSPRYRPPPPDEEA